MTGVTGARRVCLCSVMSRYCIFILWTDANMKYGNLSGIGMCRCERITVISSVK